MGEDADNGLVLAVAAAGLLWRSGLIPLPPSLSNYGGDALWALMAFYGIGLLLPSASTGTEFPLALAFSWGVEFSQLHHAPWIGAIRVTLPGRLVLCSTFNWPDLIAYAVGVAPGAYAEPRLADVAATAERGCSSDSGSIPAAGIFSVRQTLPFSVPTR